MKLKVIAVLVSLLFFTCAIGQTDTNYPVTKNMRVIMDNDFSGDPDGLFALAHLLLSPSVDVRGIVGSHIGIKDFIDPSNQQATNAAQKAKQVVQLLNMQDKTPVLTGSNTAMPNDLNRPRIS